MDTDESLKSAARRVLETYASPGDDGIRRLQDLDLLQLREAIFRRFDSNKDGGWDQEELARYLKLIPGDYVLQVQLTKRSVTLAGSKGSKFDPRDGLDLGGATVKCRASNRADMRTNLVSLLKIFALQADADKNRYLDEGEFATFQGMARGEVSLDFTFQDVDLDGNQQVTSQEIGDFFSLDGLYSQSRLEATLTDDAVTLFDLIDGESPDKRDRRLSPRDFQEGASRLLSYDANGDGALATGEILSELMLSFGQPEILSYGARNTPQQPTAQQRNAPRPQSGPLWFRRMDRNQDEDLTWGEFLGPREEFERIDRNGDGFLTLDEAEQAGRGTGSETD
jgi:Ca2+-binding EF-hand superfamily protein